MATGVEDPAMPIFDRKTTERLFDSLGLLFYVAMGAALLTALLGAPGWAFLMLILGSLAMIVRTAMELQRPSR